MLFNNNSLAEFFPVVVPTKFGKVTSGTLLPRIIEEIVVMFDSIDITACDTFLTAVIPENNTGFNSATSDGCEPCDCVIVGVVVYPEPALVTTM